MPRHFQAFGQLASAYTRHHDIGEHQVDWPLLSLTNLHRFAGITSFQYGVASHLENLARQPANPILIFHQKDSLPSPERFGWDFTYICILDWFLDRRKVNLKSSSSTRFAIDPNVSAALLDYPEHGGQAQTCASALLLRGEERLEDVRLGLFVHSD